MTRLAPSDLLLIVWLGLIGADRVDLLAGGGPILLTPFLLLTPLVLAAEAWRVVARRGRFTLPRGTGAYFLLLGAFLSTALLSVFLSYDLEMSGKRASLLVVQGCAGLLAALGLANRRDPGRILAAGAYLGLGLCVLFNVLQVAVWVGGAVDAWDAGSPVVLAPGNYYGVIPRLTGAAQDPNLGGSLILIYLFLLAVFARSSRLRSVMIALGVLSLLLTLSRSALLAALALAVLAVVGRRETRVSPRILLGAGAALSAAVVALMLSPALLDAVSGIAELLANRLNPQEGSSSEHSRVMARGLEVATHDVKRVLLGVGYGNAYLTLQDIFPGNKYGNFHSLFVTALAETGVVAMLLAVGLFAVPLVRGGVYRPLIGGLLVYNLFQQSQTDPLFWFVMALAWLGIEGAASAGPARRPPRGEPSVPRPAAAYASPISG